MRKLNDNTIAMIFGLLLGGWHLIWSILILIGLAQPFLNFIFWIHMLSVPVTVKAFTITQSLILILVTFVIGYVVGWAFAFLWNALRK